MLIIGATMLSNMPIEKEKNESISFVYWLLKNPNNFFAIAGFNSLSWSIYGVLLSIIIFLFGKSLHDPRKLDEAAILKDREPFFLVEQIYETLRENEDFQNNHEGREILCFLNILKQKLSVERDFGRGSKKITIYENEIACELNKLQTLVLYQEIQSPKWSDLKQLINVIDKMLDRRNELKKENN